MTKLKSALCQFRIYFCNHVIAKIPFHGVRQWYYRHVMGFELGRSCALLLGCRFDAARGLSLGNNSVINDNCRLDTRGGLTIGSNVSISSEVMIITAGHDPNCAGFSGYQKPVVIGDRVWIGVRAIILPGVTLCEGAVVAAGAIVTKDVESFTVVAGSPARPIGNRCSSLDYQLSYRRLFH
jgi:acetyltransferase-like isoleucine patch superfamily enzyme